MEEGGTSRLASLKASLQQASSSSDGFPALQQSLSAVLDGYIQAQRGCVAAEKVEVAQFNETVSKARQHLQAKCELLQEAVDSARAMVEDAGNPVDATKEGVKNLLAHSHKLAYTSFAPLLGPQLVDPQQGIYMPPFPQTIQLQQTFLKQYAQAKADAAVAKQAAEAQAAAAAAAKVKAAPSADMFKLPNPPKMPAGWTPGDPIPLPEGWNTGGIAPGPTPDKPAEVGPPVVPAKVPIDVNLDLDDGIDDDFILNAEAVEMASDEDSSDDDDAQQAPPGTADVEEEGRMDSDDD